MEQPVILLVEDNEDNAVICTALLEHFGLRVVRASDGEQGLRLAREIAPDLILLDISLPRLSGWDVAASLRGSPETAATPILVWTAHDTGDDRARAAQLGCEGYLSKPCAPLAVLREVERLLVGTPTPEQAPLAAERKRWWAPHPVRPWIGLAALAAVTGIAVRRQRRGRAFQWRAPSLRTRLPRLASAIAE